MNDEKLRYPSDEELPVCIAEELRELAFWGYIMAHRARRVPGMESVRYRARVAARELDACADLYLEYAEKLQDGGGS